MIDLHSHILPGIDDGAPDLEASVEMALAAVAAGTRIVVATPHVNTRYDNDPALIGRLVGELNVALSDRQIPLAILPGAEISLSRLIGLSDEALQGLSLGAGRSLLVESPYAERAALLEDALFDLQLRGFRPVLAHPERCPSFQGEPDRLAALARRGVLCSVTSGSLAGQFGGRARDLAVRLLGGGLVHDLASDAHDHARRSPDLTAGFAAAEAELPGVSEQLAWSVRAAPAAILAGEPLPPQPVPPMPAPSRLDRIARRVRGSNAGICRRVERI